MSEETPVKSYYVQLPGYDKGEVWDEAKYNRNKENLFNDHKDAMVVETSALSPEEDIAGEGMYTVHLPGFQKAELWDSDKLSRNRDALLRDHPDVEISRTTPVNYWGDRLKDNYDRVEALREELKGLPEPSVDMNISDADALAAVQDTPERRRRAEINRDIDQLLRDRENNPAYKAYWDDQKKSLASDAQRSKDEAKRIRKEDGRNLETDYYNLANRFYNDALKTANAPSKYDDSKTGFGNFVRGVGQNMMSAVSLLEFAKSLDSLNLVDTVRQVQKAKGDEADLSDLINNHPEELDFLTNGQREMLKAFVRKAEVESGRADNMSVGYNAGRGAIQSAGFMADFLLTGGVGDAAASAATRKLGLQASKDIVARGLGQQAKKLAIGNLEGAVKALAMTPMMPSSYSNFINNLTTLNEDGQMDVGAKAVLNSVGDVLIENFSENAGELFGIPFEGKLFDAISKSQLGNIGRALGRTNTGTILRQAGFHGLVGEMAEEVLGNAMRSVTGIDKDALANFFQKDEFLTTLASFAPMTVLGGIGSTASAVKTYRKASKAGSELEKILSGLGMDEAKIRELMDLSEADSPQQIGSYVSEIGREAIATGKVTRDNFQELGRALGNYTIAQSNLKVLKGVLAEEDDVRRAQDSAMISGQTGTERWWHEGEDGNGYVRTITDQDGNESFVISEMDGELALVDRSGQKTFMSTESLANGIEAGALTDSGEKAINEYLDNIEDTRTQMAEAERMSQERAEQVSSIQSRLEADPNINIGTDEAPINATVTGMAQDGVVVEWDDESGHQTRQMTWDEAGQYLGTPVEVRTDDQIEQEEAEADEEIAARRSDYNNNIPEGTEITVPLVEGEAPVTYQFKRAFVGEDGNLMLQVTDKETGRDEQITEEMALQGDLTTVLDSLKNPAETEAEETETTMENEEADDTLRDFRGNPIPLNDDGTVNQTAFWNADPEAWARWNDEKRGDNGSNSRDYIAKAVKKLQSDAKAIQEQIDKELDFDKIEQLEGQLAGVNGRIADLTRIEANYAAATASEAVQEAEANVEAAPVVESKRQETPVETTTASVQEEAVPQTPEQVLGEIFTDINQRLREAKTSEEREALMQEKRKALEDYYAITTTDPTIVGTRADILQRMEDAGFSEDTIEQVRGHLSMPVLVEGFHIRGIVFIVADDIRNASRAKLAHYHEHWHGINSKKGYPRTIAALPDVTVDALVNIADRMAGVSGEEGYGSYRRYRNAKEALSDEVIALSMEVVAESTPENIDENLREAGLDNQEIINFVKTIHDGERRNDQEADSSRRDTLPGDNAQAIERQDDGDSPARSGGDLGLQGSRPGETSLEGAGEGGLDTSGDREVTPPLTPFVKEGDKLTSYIDAPTGQKSPSAPDETMFSLKREEDSKDDEGKTVPGLRTLADGFLAKLTEKPLTPEELAIGSDAIKEMVDYMMPYLDMVKDGKRYLPEEIFGKGWSTIFKNGSYGRTMENTLICMRTLAYNDFVNAVQEKVGRPLTPTESFLASQMLYDIATDPQCLYCYVALDRKAYNGFLKTYIEQRDAVLDKYKADDSIDKTYRLPAQAKSRKNRKALPADNKVNKLYLEYLDGRADTPSMRNRFNGWLDRIAEGTLIGMKDLTSPETRQKVAGKGASYAAQIDDAEKYAQSASWAKKQEEYRAYNGELLSMPQKVVNLLNSEYGLRFYSFSEYSPAFIVENMQMVRDAALRGLVGLAYTKEIDFAKIFAPTGININISCYGREAEDGTVVMDTKQGADWGEAQALREKYGNVGCVFVATNDRMVEWALHQPWVDVIIPFHIVRTGEDIAKFYDWTNYTSMESDKDVKGRSMDIMPTEHMNDKDTFLQLCEERGLKPRFADLILPSTGRSVTEDPDYMKLVNETRRSVNETVRIKPIFDTQEAKRSFDEFVDKGGYYAGWFTEEGAFERGVEQVAADVEAGKTAKDVDYGRQDIKASAEKLAAMAGKKKRPRSHQGTPRRIGDDTKKLTKAQQNVLNYMETGEFKSEREPLEVANATQKRPVSDAVQPVVTEEDVMEVAMFRLSRNNKATVESWIGKREDLTEEQRREVVDYIDKLDDAKTQLATARWFANGTIRIPEDMKKVRQAISVAGKAKVDPLRYKSPMELLDAHAEFEPSKERINPDEVSTLHKAKEYPGGIVVYDVDDTEASRKNMRDIINSHFGEDASPWCLLQGDGKGKLTPDSKRYWRHYNAYPKQVAFKDGKLLAFSANDTHTRVWWDRQDEMHYGIPVTKKVEGDALGRSGNYILSENPDVTDTPGEFSLEVGSHLFKGNRQNGLYEEWNAAGDRILERTNYKNGKEEGLSEVWYPNNGQMERRCTYKDGNYVGTYEAWFDNGRPRVYTELDDEGRNNGVKRVWNREGILQSEGTYDHGKRVGDFSQWDDDGNLLSVMRYDADGDLTVIEEHDEFGIRQRRTYFGEDGQVLERFSRRGQLLSVERTEGGKLNGLQEQYYMDGTPDSRVEYTNGERNGLFEKYHPNGQLWIRGQFKDGKKDGVHESWSRDGVLNTRTVFKDDEVVEGSSLDALRFRKAFDSAKEDLGGERVSVDNPDLMREYGLSNVTMTKKGNLVTLNKVVVADQKKGNGTRFMNDLTSEADNNGWTLALTPDDSFGATSVGRLKKFYKRFGFKENKGRNADLTVNESMIRQPEAPRFRLSNREEMDREYMAAVEAGDMDTAQRMVDDMAEAAGYNIRGYHGTTHDFTVFDRSKGNAEGDWGKGFYFTNNEDDAATNYAGEGPDLTNRIELLAENMEWMDGYEDMSYEERLKEARKQLVGGNPHIITAAIRMENPVVFDSRGGQEETFFGYYPGDYDEERGEYWGEPSGKLARFVEAWDDVLNDYEWEGNNVSPETILEYAGDDGLTASQLEKRAREILAFVENQEGQIATGEFLRQVFERMGFDGIVDNNVNQKFGTQRQYGRGMDGMDYGTVHVIAFKPNQIKQTDPVTYDDEGKVIPLSKRFDLGNDDIRFRKVQPIVDESNEELFDAAKKRFGTTRKLSEAGYVLPDGSMLDFSGRHLLGKGQDGSWLNDQRTIDHREIQDLNYLEDFNTPSGIETDMSDFIRRGAIRLNTGVINLATKPTKGQENVLWTLISRANGDVDVDFGDGYDSDHYASYDNARPERILNDIRRYFDEGVNPEGNVMFSKRTIETEDGETISYESMGGLPIEAGRVSLAERTYKKSGVFSFTGSDKVVSSADVAYIFKELENSATENSFLVFVKNGKPTILHTGMGDIKSTTIDFSAMVAGLKDFAPDEIYMVHNHPSGKVEASRADWKLITTLQKMAGKIPVQGVIIDTYTGEYGIFSNEDLEEGFGLTLALTDEREHKATEDVPLEVLTFDQMVYNSDYRSSLGKDTIRGAQDVAAFLSAHRLGEGEKVGALLLNRANVVVGNLIFNDNVLTSDNAESLARDAVDAAVRSGAEDIILYGDMSADRKTVMAFKDGVDRLGGGDIKWLDAIKVDGNHTRSLAEGTLMDSAGETLRIDPSFIGRELNKDEIDEVIRAINSIASGLPEEIPFTKENYDALFAEGTDTPIGHVKMSENQFTKFSEKGREWQLAMADETLRTPAIIIEKASEAKEGQETERPSSYIFVKTFDNPEGKGKKKIIYYNSITAKRDGLEIVMSNYDTNRNRVKADIEKGKLTYVNSVALSSESGTSVQGDQFAVPAGDDSSTNKDTNSSDNSNSILKDSAPEYGDAPVMFRKVTDPDTLERLESEPTIKVYRAMQEIDGKLYPPMAAKVEGRMQEPIELGVWEEAVERPELADAKGKFSLNKGNGKSLKARYNPYIHTSRSPLNDQFTSAYDRPNLVTVEVEVPESELTSGYKAEKAKDAVGEMTWHSGPVSGKLPEGKKRKVILSRWDRPVRIVPDSEVAERIAELLEGENLSIPYNTVTPSLREELEKRGVQISDTPSGNVKSGKSADERYADAVKEGDMETASLLVGEAAANALPDTKVTGEDGKPLVVYHGGTFGRQNEDLDADPYVWEGEYGNGWFTPDKTYSGNYTPWGSGKEPIGVFLDIRNPFDMGDTQRLLIDNYKPTELAREYAKRLNVKVEDIIDLIDTDYSYEDNKGVTYKAEAFAINRNPKFAELLASKGFDGAMDVEPNGAAGYMVVRPNQIKLADPVTRDNSGEVIPLSDRFNLGVDDIRFRKSQNMISRSREGGLAGVIGEEDAAELYRDVYRAIPGEIRQMAIDKAGDSYIFTDAVRDMISEAVEKGDETGIAGLAANMLRNYVGDLDERTARYILWRGTRKEADDDLIDTVNDIAMQRRLQVGEFAEPPMFRKSPITPEQDKEYTEAVQSGDMTKAQQMVLETARTLGYDSPILYHGSDAFGFTTIDLGESDDRTSFWATDSEKVAGSYTQTDAVRNPGSEITPEKLEQLEEKAQNEIDEEIHNFRRLIDKYFSEWFFGNTGDTVIRNAVMNANSEKGWGDGVYDVLEDFVADAYGDYGGEEFGEEYEDFADWQEYSPEARKIYESISSIEGLRLKYDRITRGDVIGGIYQLVANTDNLFVVDAKGALWDELHPEGLPKIERGQYKDIPYRTRDVVKWAKDNGYDGVFFKNIKDNGEYGRTEPSNVYAFFNPQSQVKSAEPVTYDDNGNVIPLSERFNPDNEDIRFRLSDDVREAETRVDAMADDAKATMDEKKEDARENDALTTVKAMSLQKEYDRKTVNAITVLAKNIIKDQNIDTLNRREIARLLGIITTSVGKAPKTVKKNADALMGLVVDHLLRSEETKLGMLVSIKAEKTNQTGVNVAAKLDPRGQNILKAYKAGLDMDTENPNDEFDETTIKGRLAELSEKMEDTDEAVRAEAEDEYAGLMLALEYKEQIKAKADEERSLKTKLAEAVNEFKDGKRPRESYNQFVAETEKSIRENRIGRIEAYRELYAKVQRMISGSAEALKEFREREKNRIDEIHHLANSDMQGISASPEEESSTLASRLANSSIVRFFARPLATFDQMLRLFGQKNITGEGNLFNKFHRAWIEATERAYLGEKEAKAELDAKVSEVFDRKMRWSDLYTEERKMPTVKAKWWDSGRKEMVEHELTQGQLLYIYMVNKMTDGRMKLRRMGITQETVDAIARQMDERFIELADWLQGEYLVNLRNKYDAVHVRLFGAHMAAIEDYFPLKINKRSLNRAEDIGRPDFDDALPATTTGSIIARRRNTQDLDLLNADAFSVVIEHVEQMEKWAAFAEFNKDLNALLSYKRFRNQVQNMTSVYGSGRELWGNFKAVCQIAGGAYRPAGKKSKIDTDVLNIAKGVTAAKISLRVYTAIKQFLSMPAFISDANIKYLATNLATPWKAWNWAMENLPMFEKRWKSRMAGDTRLMKTDSDWKVFQSKTYDFMSRIGMSPNAFVDAWTVAVGSHSIYQTRYDRYIKDGYTEEQADKKAKQDATTLYNETQQSNEAAFVSQVQLDRTIGSTALTVFRNSSMGYQRQLHDAIRNLGKYLKPGYKAVSIDFMTRQMMRDGLTEEQARHAAERNYNRELGRSLSRIGTFGFLVQFAWNLGGSIAYLLFGDDDDKKEEMLSEAFVHGLIGGSMEGLAGGNILSEAINMAVKGENLNGYDPSLLPIFSDIKNTFSKMGSNPVAGWYDLICLGVQAGLGFNPQTISDAVVAVVDACGGDLGTSKEAMLLIMRVLQVPQSQVDQIYIDELGTNAAGARKMSPTEMAERYARYKINKEAGPLGWAYSDEAEEKREKAYLKSFNKKVKERKSE